MTALVPSPAVAALEPRPKLRADSHPALVYLARLSPSSRRTVRQALARVVALVTGDPTPPPWVSGSEAARGSEPLAGEWQDRLVDERESMDTELAERQEQGRRQRLLSVALESLTDRERSIIVERRLREHPTSLDEVAQKWGISRERVRQIEMRAVQKLRWSVKATRPGLSVRTEAMARLST